MIIPFEILSIKTLKKCLTLNDIAAPFCQKILSNNLSGPKNFVKITRVENKILVIKK